MQIKLVSHPGDEQYMPTEEMREAERRQAHQRMLEFARRVQSHTGPLLAPGIDGVVWSQMRPTEADETGSPKIPILSLFECTLKPDVDIHDGSRLPRKLWDAVLTYISSLPGCDAVEWGLELDGDDYASPTALFCMIHWDSVLAWWTFHHSPAFSPLLALLVSNISKRCAKLGVPGVPRLGDTQQGVAVVDVITIVFDAKDVPSPGSRSAFKEDWKALVDPVYSEHSNSLRHSYTVWLENNVVTLPEPTPAEAAVGTQFSTFTAFLAWNREGYNSARVGELCDNLRALLESSCPSVPTISRKAVRLINGIHQEDHTPSQEPAGSYSLASILETNFPRKGSSNIPGFIRHYIDINNLSVHEAQTRRRPFPAPRGFLPLGYQGSFFQGSMAPLPPLLGAHQPVDGNHFLDVVWMQLTYRTRRSEAPHIYDRLNDEIRVLPGCVKTYWARDPEHNKKFSVLTVWESQDARKAGLHDYRQILDRFAALSVQLAVPLIHHGFPISRGHQVTGPWLDRVSHLEIIRFYVSLGLIARQTFEYAYWNFKRMTVPTNMGGGPRPACDLRNEAAWEQPIEEIESDSDFQIFTAVMAWETPDARKVWYQELFGLSRESYEMFGQTLDVLKIVATGGVESRFLALQS